MQQLNIDVNVKWLSIYDLGRQRTQLRKNNPHIKRKAPNTLSTTKLIKALCFHFFWLLAYYTCIQ